MIKKHAAFTLIELMVVVAIIAILATMGVANFSTAIRKARNSTRLNDVTQVSKSLETCYDIMNAVYWKDPSGTVLTDNRFTSQAGATGADSDSPFKGGINKCLDQDIVPSLDGNDYGIYVTKDPSEPQKYVVCADLEYVGGWETMGNVQGHVADNDVPKYEEFAGDVSTGALPTITPCDAETDTSDGCMFCVAAQQ